MDEALLVSVYPVESRRQGDNTLGTGFIIYQDQQFSYLLTCAHVVEDIGSENLQIDGTAATVEVIGASDHIDFAVLRVPGLPQQAVPDLLVVGEEGNAITIVGMHDFGHYRSRRSVRGQLGSPSSLKKPKTQGGWIKAWELKLELEEHLQPGYSGSPVIHNLTGTVLAVATHRLGKGERGLAISIEGIRELWQPHMHQDWVETLIRQQEKSDGELKTLTKQPPKSIGEIERIHRQLKSLENAWNILAVKVESLQADRINETRTDEVSRLGHVISRAKQQQQELEAEIDSLTARLQELQA